MIFMISRSGSMFLYYTYLIVVTSLMGWTTEESGFDSRQEQEIFHFSQRPGQLWDSPSLLSNGYQQLFPQE
jgi:hypothetical protein